MQAHTHTLSQACLPDHNKVLAFLGQIWVASRTPTVSTQAKWAGHRPGKEQVSWSASHSTVNLPH